MSDTKLNNTIAGISFKNPLFGASGTFGYGHLYDDFYALDAIGGFFSKGLSLLPKVGNPPPRICETASGMLNAIGLQNIGLDNFVEKKLPKLESVDTALIVNFFGNSIEEYADLAARLNEHERIDGLEMNISCPNVKEGGIQFGADPKVTAQVVAACRKATTKPLIVKLSPNVTDIKPFAAACEDEGADALSVINTLVGMAIDIDAQKPVLTNITGGLSGPAIKPVALRMVWECYRAVKIPIFGIGGITSATDALEFFMAGASAVQVGTHNFVEPDVLATLPHDLEKWLDANNVAHYRDLIGIAHRQNR